MMAVRRRLLLLGVALACGLLWGCGEARNMPPEILSFSCQPTIVGVGEPVRCVVQARDPEGMPLSYTWFVSGACVAEAIRDGRAVVTCSARGDVIVGVVVRDPFGAEAQADTFISVR
jgi:hypothetical protein